MNKSTFDSLIDGVYDCMGVQRSVEDGGPGSGRSGHVTVRPQYSKEQLDYYKKNPPGKNQKSLKEMMKPVNSPENSLPSKPSSHRIREQMNKNIEQNKKR